MTYVYPPKTSHHNHNNAVVRVRASQKALYMVVIGLLATVHCHASTTQSLSGTKRSSTGTHTKSRTPSESVTPTLSITLSYASWVGSASASVTPTVSASFTLSLSGSSSTTITPPPTPTPTATTTTTYYASRTLTGSLSPTVSRSTSSSWSGSLSASATISNTTTPPPTPTPTALASTTPTTSSSPTTSGSSSISHTMSTSLSQSVSNTTTPPPTPTPTASASATGTYSSSHTFSGSASISYTASASLSPTISNTTTPPPTPTPTASASSTGTDTWSVSTSLTATLSKSETISTEPSGSATPTTTLSNSGSISAERSGSATTSVSTTGMLSSSRSSTVSASPTDSESPTGSVSSTPDLSSSPSESISGTPSLSSTASSSMTPSHTASMTLSWSHSPTSSESPSWSVPVTSSISSSLSSTVTTTATMSFSVTQSHSVTVTTSASTTASPSQTMSPSVSMTPSPSTTGSSSATTSKTDTASGSPTSSLTPSVTRSGTTTLSPSDTSTDSGSETISLSQTMTESQSFTESLSETASVSLTISMTQTLSISASGTATSSVSPSHTKSLSLSSSLFEKTPGVGVCYSQQALYTGVVFTITVEGKNFADTDRYLIVENRSECWWRPVSEFQQVFWVSAPRKHAIVRNQISGYETGFYICYRSHQFDLDFNFSCPQKFFPQQAVAPWVDQQHLRQLASAVVIGGTGLTMDALNAVQCISGYVPTYNVELAYASGVLTNPVSSVLQFGNATQRIRISEVCTFLIVQDTPVSTPGSEGVNSLNASSAGNLAFLFEVDSLLDESDVVLLWKRVATNASNSGQPSHGIPYLSDVPAINFEGVSPNCPRSLDGYVPAWVVPLGQRSLRVPPGDYVVTACAGIDGRGYSSTLTYTRVATVCPNDCREGGGAIRGTCNETTAQCQCHYPEYGGEDCAQPFNCSLDARFTTNITASSGSWSMSGARQCGALLEADGSDLTVGGGFGIGVRVTHLTLSSNDCSEAYVELRAEAFDGPIIRTLCAADANSVNSVLSPIYFNASLRIVHVSYVSNSETDGVNISFVSVGTACPGIPDASGFVPSSGTCSGRGVCVDVDFSQLRDFPLSSKKCSCDNPWAADRPGASCETCARGNVQWTFPACVAIPVCEWNCNNRGNCTTEGCACFYPYFGRVCELNPTEQHLQASQWLKGRISFDGASGAVQSDVPTFLSCQVSGCKVARRSTGIVFYAGDDALKITLAEDTRALVQSRSFLALDATTTVAPNTSTNVGDEGISFNPVKREGAGDYYEQTNVSATPVDVAGESTTTVWARLTRNSNGFLFAKLDSVSYSDGTMPMLEQAFFDVQDRHAPLSALKLRDTNTSLYFAIYVNGNRDRLDIMSVDVDRRDGTDSTSYCSGADASRCSESDGASGSGRDDWFFSRSFRLNSHYRNVLFDGNWHFIAVTVRRGSGRYEGQVYIDGGSIDGNVNFVQCLPFLPNAIANSSFQRAQKAAMGDPSVTRIGPGGSVVIGYGLQGSVDEMRFYVPSLRQMSLVKIAGPDYDGALTITKDGLVACTALSLATVIGGLVLFCARREGIRLEGELRHSGKNNDDAILDTSDEDDDGADADQEEVTQHPHEAETAVNPLIPPSTSSGHGAMASPQLAAADDPFAFPKRSTSIETPDDDDDEGLWTLLGLAQTTPLSSPTSGGGGTKGTPPPAAAPTTSTATPHSKWGILQAKMRSALKLTEANNTAPKPVAQTVPESQPTAESTTAVASDRRGSRHQRESIVVVLPTATEEEAVHARSSDSFDGEKSHEGTHGAQQQLEASRRVSVSSFLEDAAAQRRFSAMQMKESQNSRSNRKLRSAAVALGNAITVSSSTGLDGFDSIGSSAIRGLAQGAAAAQDVWQYIALHMSGFPWPDLFQYSAGQIISIVSLSFEVSFRISFETSFYACAAVGLAAFAVVVALFIIDLMKSEEVLAREAAEREAAQLRQLELGGEAAKLQRSTKEKLVWAALFTLTTLYMPITRNAVIGAFCYRTIQCEFDCYNEARHWRIVYFSALLMLVVTVMVPVILIAVTFRKLRQFAGNRIDESKNDAAISEDVTLEKDWQQFLAMDNSPYAGAYENFKFRWCYFQSVLILSKALCVFLALGLDTNTSPQLLSITVLHCAMTFLIAATSPFIADVSNLITIIGQVFVVLTLGLNAISRLDPDESIGVYMGYALIASSLLCVTLQLVLLKRYFSIADLIGGLMEMMPCIPKRTSRPGTGSRRGSKV